LHVVADGNIEAVALPGQFGDEQCEQGFLSERLVVLGGWRLCYNRSFFHVRCAVWVGEGKSLAATQQSKGGQ
jgi:hypothetical protein